MRILFPSLVVNPCGNSESVTRGIRAINTMYNMTTQIPELMQQSHLERRDGTLVLYIASESILTISLSQRGQLIGCLFSVL